MSSVAIRFARLAGTLLLLLAPAVVRANVSIELQLGSFYQPDGVSLIPDGSVGVLVADTTGGGFLDIGDLGGMSTAVDSSWGADNHLTVLGAFSFIEDVDSGIHFFFGNFVFDLTGNLSPGDALGFYWFPEITTIGDVISLDMSWGFYRNNAVDVLTSDSNNIGFVVPSDGSSPTLASFDQSIVPGSLASVADFTTTAGTSAVPEPSTCALLAGLAGLTVAGWRRRRTRARVAGAGA
ncbi:MAG TPA: PEP-CTERM sorting domain-containing protein [Opitutus sp.]|nr:PEP-CTERM sorting domain-containing protein [Opitutus sp.]